MDTVTTAFLMPVLESALYDDECVVGVDARKKVHGSNLNDYVV